MMENNGEGHKADQLEARLRSMILDNNNVNSGVKQTTHTGTSVELPDKTLLVPPKPQKKFRARKEYVKLDLNSASNPPISSRHEPSSQRPREPRVSQQHSSTGQFRPIDASYHVMSRPHMPHPSKTRTALGPQFGRSKQPVMQHSASVRQMTAEQSELQCFFLETVAQKELVSVEIRFSEVKEKDQFRAHLQRACHGTLAKYFPHLLPLSALLAFGSISSGFGMPGCDMDLAFMPSYTKYDMPKALEKCLLDLGHGARLLTRTRVPILKVCERPTPTLLAALREERQKFDDLPTLEEKETYMNPPFTEKQMKEDTKTEDLENVSTELMCRSKNEKHEQEASERHTAQMTNKPNRTDILQDSADKHNFESVAKGKSTESRKSRPWHREKRLGPLDFPKEGVGIQCDINFSNSLGLHNSLLLRCYSHCDIRVRLMVLFVKKWAKQRKINSSYSGTLSSYGYVLMVLHFLVNIAEPPVCPNLQLVAKQSQRVDDLLDPNCYCEGADVRFWRDEEEIKRLASKGMLGRNNHPLGRLLRDFFHYYAQRGHDVPRGGFQWTFQVLSLRTEGGLVSKPEKGWTEARTTMEFQREIRNRYLFAIEDPFEITHNVARTVTHYGIVAIRDEFRRAWRIISAAGRNQSSEGELFAPIIEQENPVEPHEKLQGTMDASAKS